MLCTTLISHQRRHVPDNVIAQNEPSRNAVIQGASRGLGLAFVQELLADPRYGRVVATCRDPARALALREVQASNAGRLDIVALDVTLEESVRAAAEETAKLTDNVSLLVNCAGILHGDNFGPERRLADVEPEQLQRVFAVNAFGPLLVAKHFAPLFHRRERVVLASLSARVGSIDDNALGGWYSYRASKAAQNMFTRNLSIELKRRHRGIICVALHPGTVDTDLSQPFQRGVPAHKLFPVDRAAAQLVDVIEGLGQDDNGRFYAWDGSEIAW
ncbi:MAG: SDR family oxidoreductase [Gammaproteobacteria bacterium]|jgi:NAD(P)-dependent dehydrogenase (short-subunit alcohol dehydrogenase family)